MEEIHHAQAVLERALWSSKVAGSIKRMDLPVDQGKPAAITRFAWLGRVGSARTDEIGADGYETSCAWTPSFVFRVVRESPSKPWSVNNYRNTARGPDSWRDSTIHPIFLPCRWKTQSIRQLLDMDKDGIFTVDSVTADGERVAIEFKGRQDIPGVLACASATLRRDLHFAIERFAVYESPVRMKERNWSWLIENQFRSDATLPEGLPRLVRLSLATRDSATGVGARSIFEIDMQQYGCSCADVDFSLQAFGLPDPALDRQARSAWSKAWLIVGGLVALAAMAFAAGGRKRKRP